MKKSSVFAIAAAIFGMGVVGATMTNNTAKVEKSGQSGNVGQTDLHELRPITALNADGICAKYLNAFPRQEDMTPSYGMAPQSRNQGAFASLESSVPVSDMAPMPSMPPPLVLHPRSGDQYDGEEVSDIIRVSDVPVSTFSVDVDTASYANARRFISNGSLPPSAAVRTEEMLNYFRYDYGVNNNNEVPFDISTDIVQTPWNEDTRIVRIGLTGDGIEEGKRPPMNLVFLVDVSGSMMDPNKLPLVKCSMALAAEQMTDQDRISVVKYSGSSGVVLEPTSDKQKVLEAIDALTAGGSTAGEAAIRMAYDVAYENFSDGKVNRILLATDGDFNVGISDKDDLISLVENERAKGVSLTALGFGSGNLNDAMMEQIADHGNGNYFYIDSPAEAEKVLVEEMVSTIFTVAKDVKIQVEFNPAYISEYRLIGYENRTLREEDFDNDRVDAGEIGSGHQVTAIYEVVPVGMKGWFSNRRYSGNERKQASGDLNGEAAMISLRFKQPEGDISRKVQIALESERLQSASAARGETAFAVAVAGYGQKLRGDEWIGKWTFSDSAKLARSAASDDLRKQFIELAERASQLAREG